MSFRIIVLIWLLLSVFVNCKFNKKETTTFKSNFERIEDRTWLGSEYWASSAEEWQIHNKRIECLVSNKNRNIHLLTRHLGTNKGTLEMKVRVGFFNKKILNSNKNWAGFNIGSKDKYSKFKDNAAYGRGINIGICTNGSLFIGEHGYNQNNNQVIKELSKGVDLKVTLTPKGINYIINISIYSISTGELLGSISKDKVSSKQLYGGLVLVSNFENPTNSSTQDNTKSVWFKNWNIKGSKVTKYDNKTFGPILFSQYTLRRNTLELTAQMTPVKESFKQVHLEIKENKKWKSIASSFINKDSYTARFKLPNWDNTKDYPYRLVYDFKMSKGKTKTYYWEGIICK